MIKSPSALMSRQVHPSKSKAVNTSVPLIGERVQGSWWHRHLPTSPVSALTITFRAGKSAENYINLAEVGHYPSPGAMLYEAMAP